MAVSILIHTSVKLVTCAASFSSVPAAILIHTSVKLVTRRHTRRARRKRNFNPHEREARDLRNATSPRRQGDFNPHEREARDYYYSEFVGHFLYFNPHEREARDFYSLNQYVIARILIHTSVKLVTPLKNGTTERPKF